MMLTELLPCPFCGQEKPSLSQAGGYWRIKCVDGCSVAITGYYNRQLAIDAWNRRPHSGGGTEAKRAISDVLRGLTSTHEPRYWMDDEFIRWGRVEDDLQVIIDRLVSG